MLRRKWDAPPSRACVAGVGNGCGSGRFGHGLQTRGAGGAGGGGPDREDHAEPEAGGSAAGIWAPRRAPAIPGYGGSLALPPPPFLRASRALPPSTPVIWTGLGGPANPGEVWGHRYPCDLEGRGGGGYHPSP